jgi:hypothetical protein
MLGIAAPWAARSGGGKTRVSTKTDSIAFDMILSPNGDFVVDAAVLPWPPNRKLREGVRRRDISYPPTTVSPRSYGHLTQKPGRSPSNQRKASRNTRDALKAVHKDSSLINTTAGCRRR